MIYLDNGATTYPKPQEVQMQMQRALREFGANPGRSGYVMSVKTGEAVFACRSEIADFFHADGPECVIFQPSCTQALNLVIKGTLSRGDHVVVSDMEHNAAMRPLKKLNEQDISFTVAKSYPGNPDLTVDSFRRAMSAQTKLIVCMHASNVLGTRFPVERLAALAHFYGAKICVDTAQSAGVLPIDIKESGIDYICGAGHKGLYGPMGTGFLIIRRDDTLNTLIEGGTGTKSRDLNQPEDPPERYESGTQNIPGILGLHAGVRFVRKHGIENIYRHEIMLTEYLKQALLKIDGIEVYCAEQKPGEYVPVLSFNVEGLTSEETAAYLAKSGIAVRAGCHCAPSAHEKIGTDTGTVRVAPSVFTKQNEINFLIRKINELVYSRKNAMRR